MKSLSLSPRFDLSRLRLPKTFLPDVINTKYSKLLNERNNIISTPIEYLNESIQSVSIPGITDISVDQIQHEKQLPLNTRGKTLTRPAHEVTYVASTNPLSNIDKSISINFRMNEGFYNYFMIYETIFYIICDPEECKPMDVVILDIFDDNGNVISKVKFFDVYVDSIDGIDFDYSNNERSTEVFSVNFKFNNIDFDLMVD